MIQLRLKTEYSFGRTFAPIGRMIDRLKGLNCTAAGIVDGSSWGHVAWYNACRKAGIRPLLGIESIVSDDDTASSMWFLAKNKAGLVELYRAISKSYHQKIKLSRGALPRLHRLDVRNMSDNIFKFAGDITDGPFLKDIEAVLDLNPSSRILNVLKRQLARKHHLKMVDTSDNAFVHKTDVDVYEMMSKAGLKVTPQYILETLECQGTARAIAKACEELELPKAPNLHAEGDLEKLCRKGIKYRKMKWTKKYEERLQYELELIRAKKYESYFIIVADMVHYAKKHMLVGPSRGSAAGSLVCYTTRITEIDPIPPGLYFERFIDPTRVDLPDIDLDFPDNKRHMVFEYMAKKYGEDNVAHIGTISRFKPRSALIQVCKALNIPPQATAPVKVAMIERSSADARASNCLEDTLNETSVGKQFLKQYPQAVTATLLEGHASHTGVHAAGLLVCDNAINDYCVVDDKGVAHVEKKAAAELGLLKIDVLGLRTLGILEDSGVKVDWYGLKFNDKKTFNVFNSGNLCGIFQFDGQAMRSIASLIDVRTLTEVDAITALARPGPFRGGVTKQYIERKNGTPYKPIHPKVEAQMKETFGLPIYQEQTLAIVHNIGKFNWTETADIRTAMSKSLGEEFFDKYTNRFIKGALSQGVDEEGARTTWELINHMGAWQMNKAHTYSYAVISYWTAYLKAHYPLEFAAANLRNAKDNDHAILLLRELKREGIDYVPFDLECSKLDWSVIDGKLYGGFLALRGIGESKGAKLIDARDKGALTKKQLEQLAKAQNPFDNIFPFHTYYQDYYDNPEAHGISSGKVWEVADINMENGVPHGHTRVFLAELIHKNARNANEDVNIKKRNGVVATGPLEYVDVRLRDDHAVIGGRVDRYRFEKLGRKLLEEVDIGAHLLIRAKFFNGIPWAFISKWKEITPND